MADLDSIRVMDTFLQVELVPVSSGTDRFKEFFEVAWPFAKNCLVHIELRRSALSGWPYVRMHIHLLVNEQSDSVHTDSRLRAVRVNPRHGSIRVKAVP